MQDVYGQTWTRPEPGLLRCDADGAQMIIAPEATDAQCAASIMSVTLEHARSGLDAAVERHLNANAAVLGYTSMERAATYAASKVPKFSAEAHALIDWRDAVWLHCYQALADVGAGLRAIPTAPELIAELPVFVPPQA